MKTKHCKIWTDGSTSKANPGPMGIGVVIKEKEEEILTINRDLRFGTNNMAEFLAVLYAIRAIKKRGYNSFELRADSKLVIMGLKDEWKIRHENIVPIYKEIKKEIKGLKCFFIWVPREENTHADELSKVAD
jgi:ribonuclease HI